MYNVPAGVQDMYSVHIFHPNRHYPFPEGENKMVGRSLIQESLHRSSTVYSEAHPGNIKAHKRFMMLSIGL
jgi:hypothetical protein